MTTNAVPLLPDGMIIYKSTAPERFEGRRSGAWVDLSGSSGGASASTTFAGQQVGTTSITTLNVSGCTVGLNCSVTDAVVFLLTSYPGATRVSVTKRISIARTNEIGGLYCWLTSPGSPTRTLSVGTGLSNANVSAFYRGSTSNYVAGNAGEIQTSQLLEIPSTVTSVNISFLYSTPAFQSTSGVRVRVTVTFYK